MDFDSQCKIILAWLKQHGYIDRDIAKQICSCERLAARIKDLRNAGFQIETEIKKYINKKTGRPVRYAVYRLKEDNHE